MRRLLKLFDKYNIKTTWFIPGHSLDTFPEECAMIRDAGHEMLVLSVHLFMLCEAQNRLLTVPLLVEVCMAIRTRTPLQ